MTTLSVLFLSLSVHPSGDYLLSSSTDQVCYQGFFRKIPKRGQKHVGRHLGGDAYSDQNSILKS